MWFWLRTFPFQQWLRPQRLATLEACLIGLVAGLAAVVLEQGITLLGQWRISLAHLQAPWLVLPLFGMVAGLLAGWLVERFSPESSGSGIPQVKAVLARVPIALDLRVALFKLLGGILVIGSGFPLGREGPTVQIGGALAAQISRWVPTSPAYRRQLLAAGAGAGLAAAFNAPIAGVIFVVEELLRDVSGLTLGPAILASFIASVLARVLGDQSFNLQLRLVATQTGFAIQEIPLYILLGVAAGLFGALFNRSILAGLDFNRRILRLRLPLRVALAGLVVGLVIAQLPEIFRNSAGLREMISGGTLPWHLVALAFVSQFCLTVIAYSSGAPGGLFAPSLIMGTSLGYLMGVLSEHVIGLNPPVTFALAGMGAFFAAVARVPITAIVIVFEMTNDFNLVLPLMIVCAVSYLVAERLFPGSIYDRLLEFNGIHLEREKERSDDNLLGNLVAGDVMQTRVETLSARMPLSEVTEAFSRSHHRGFPVVDGKQLIGIVTQSDLARIAERRLADAQPLSEIMTTQPITVGPTERLSEVLFLLNRFNLSRLPVADDRRLVGIITRSDIIRAESDLLSGSREPGPATAPSYTVYQTREPTIGAGRILVPLANPQTAPALLRFAAAIARERHYELECLHVITVPRSSLPSDIPVQTVPGRRLVAQARRLGHLQGISVHTQIRVAHDIAQAVLETIKERRIDVLLMGWQGSTDTPGRIFSSAVDTLIRQAPCEAVLVHLKGERVPRQWLVPVGGGPNAQEAVKLLPALLSCAEGTSQVTVCQVFADQDNAPDTELLEADARALARSLGHPVNAAPLRSDDVAGTLVNFARQGGYDGIIIGASRESLLRQVVNGNIPEAVARNSDCTVVLVRT